MMTCQGVIGSARENTFWELCWCQDCHRALDGSWLQTNTLQIATSKSPRLGAACEPTPTASSSRRHCAAQPFQFQFPRSWMLFARLNHLTSTKPLYSPTQIQKTSWRDFQMWFSGGCSFDSFWSDSFAQPENVPIFQNISKKLFEQLYIMTILSYRVRVQINAFCKSRKMFGTCQPSKNLVQIPESVIRSIAANRVRIWKINPGTVLQSPRTSFNFFKKDQHTRNSDY